MSDEVLRVLEKALAADPSVANRWRYARALERAGRRRELFFELCELSRAGEAEARARVERWTPWTARTGAMGRRRALDLSRKTTTRSHTLSIPGEEEPGVIAATDDTLYVSSALARGHFLGAISLETFAPRWHTDEDTGSGAIALVGDDVVHSTARGLVLRDGRTGDVLAEWKTDEPAENVFHAGGDRVVVELDSRLVALAVEAGRFVGPLWTGPIDAGPPVAATDTRLLFHSPGAFTTCAAIEDGRRLWSRSVLDEPGPGLAYEHGLLRALGPVASGVLVWASTTRSAPIDLAVSLDLETGELAGGRLPARVRQESMPPERFDADSELLAIGRHGSLEPDDDALDIALGEVLLVRRSELSGRAPFADVGRVVAAPRDLRALALAPEALYVTNLAHETKLLVRAYGRESGALLFEMSLTLPFEPARALLIPVEGALVVAATTDYNLQLFLARVENDAP